MPTRSFPSLAPLDPAAVIPSLGVGRGDPSIAIDDGAWIALNLPSGETTLRLEGHDTTITAEAWGPGAGEALERAPGIVGADDDPTGFHTAHPLINRLQRQFPAVRVTRSLQITASLVRTVFGQKVTGKEAARSYRRMTNALGTPAPGPRTDLKLPVPPEHLRTLGYEDFHPWGVEGKRADTILEVARRSGRLEEAADMPLADAYRRIQAVRGIGPWSAALVGLQALGDADAVPVGDYHIPNSVSWALAGEPRGTDDRMLELLEPFRPHRGRVVLLLKAAGLRAPKYGPRAPLRNIERM